VPKKNGRPFLLHADEPTLTQLKGLAQIGCTVQEVAAFFKVSKDTVDRFLHRPEVREAFDQGKGNGHISLRRVQFDSAMKGNTRMQIWLGKQWLDQVDKQELGGPGGAPLMLPGPSVTVYALPDNGRGPAALPAPEAADDSGGQ
jgi:hypothetical protein